MNVIDLPAWVTPYIGIPFRDLGRDLNGCDCWGLTRLVYARERGIGLASYDGYEGTSEQDIPRIAELIEEGLATGEWIDIPAGEERPFDGALIRKRGHPTHTGLVVVPGAVLHTLFGAGSTIFEYRVPQPRHRILGFYRHRALA